MKTNNENIYDNFQKLEIELNEKVKRIVKEKNEVVFQELLGNWQTLNLVELKQAMLDEFKLNYESFWINPKTLCLGNSCNIYEAY